MEFVFMLTDNDRTVPHALEVLDELKGVGLRHVGFKDVGATPEMQKRIAGSAHDCGLTVHLEVVSISREDEAASIQAAIAADVDYVVGGKYAEDAVAALKGTGIRFLPFPGKVVGHPSILEGTVESITRHAADLSAMEGVYGVDLLAYRNANVETAQLIREVVAAVSGPVLVAGSVVTERQIRDIDDAGAWGFTIGGAIFQGLLPGEKSIRAQVSTALGYSAGHVGR